MIFILMIFWHKRKICIFYPYSVLLVVDITMQHMTVFVIQGHNYPTKSVDGQSNSTKILTVYH